MARQKQGRQSHKSDKSKQNRSEEALELLEQLAVELWGDHDLQKCLKVYLMALRFLGWDDEWVSKELEGYLQEDEPSWRIVTAPAVWSNKKGDSRGQSDMATVYVRQSVSDLYGYRIKGFKFTTGKKSKGDYGEEMVEWVSIPAFTVEMIFGRISQKLFRFVCDALVSLKFGEAADSVFREYQRSVSQAMSRLGIEDYLENAYQNLQGGNKASWQMCALACRNILLSLGNTLYQAPGTSYPYIQVEGKPMPVGRNNEVNRILAYLHQNNIKKDELLVQILKPLYKKACRGKSDMTYKEAQSILISTYIFVGELGRRTNMQPVMDLREL